MVVPSWYSPPTPTPMPIIVQPTDNSSSGGVSTLVLIFIFSCIALLGIWICIKIIGKFLQYAKENDWVYTTIFWGLIILAIIYFLIIKNKDKPTTTTINNPRYTCNCSKTCPNMTCTEAYYQLEECGCTARDGDGDGIPCEAQCK